MAKVAQPSLDIKELPSLKYARRSDRLAMDSDPSILSVLNLKKKILTNDFVEFQTQLSKLNDMLHKLLEVKRSVPKRSDTPFSPDFTISDDKGNISVIETKWRPKVGLTDITWSAATNWNQMWRYVAGPSADAEERISKLERELNEFQIDMIKKSSNELERTISEFEQKNAIDLAIHETSTLYICPSCKRILGRSKFRKWKCNCGEDIKQPPDVERVPVVLLTKYVAEFLENNYWFEYGTAIVLRRKGYDTFTSYEVMGGSGVLHEIDVIAQKRKTKIRIFIECKTGQVTVQDVFVLAGKMRDIGVSIGMICSARGEQNPEIRLVARANGIIMAYNVVDKPTEFWDNLLSKVDYDI